MVRCFDGLSTGQVTTSGLVPFALSLSKRLRAR
jgi:hypothetical protein